MTSRLSERRKVAAAIVAGGAGRRMGGVDKTKLVIAGQTILERQLAVLKPRFSRVFLVTAPPSDNPAPLHTRLPARLHEVHDRGAPGRGPLAGIEAALAALSADEDAVVCVAGDMPLLQPALLELVRDQAPAALAVVPRLGRDRRPEPLLARYQRGCLPAIVAA
ncbi:MAG TPA: NTP transferase domain-containing protein, partial [Polyangia bacterium]